MHTNKTTNYELPQFVGSDIINPLTDLNGAFQTIDGAMKENADDIAGNTGDILTLNGDVSTLGGKVTALETQNGSEILNTTKQTLSGAVNELDAEINTTGTGLEARVGTATLLTTATDCRSAINELYQMIQNL
jgi:hypothetical protein